MKKKSRIKLYQILLIGHNFKFDKTVIGFKSYSRVCHCSSQVYLSFFFILHIKWIRLSVGSAREDKRSYQPPCKSSARLDGGWFPLIVILTSGIFLFSGVCSIPLSWCMVPTVCGIRHGCGISDTVGTTTPSIRLIVMSGGTTC